MEQQIASEVASRHGLTARADWDACIRRALGEVGPAIAAPAPLDRETVDRVAGHLTICETFFMRHHSQLVFAAEQLASRLSRGAPRVRVLSAGCSSGEEPYSLVLCLMRLLGRYPPLQAEVIGCDLSPAAIEKARRAEYGTWSFRGAPRWLLDQHFEVVRPGQYRLCEEVRSRVTLRRASVNDVLDQYPGGTLDLVLFRNVGIYLTEEYLGRLFAQFRRVLGREGLLVVAPSDPRPHRDLFRRVPHESTGIYQPTETGPPAAAPTTPQRRRADTASIDAAPRAPQHAPGPAAMPDLPSPSSIREMADGGELAEALDLAHALADSRPMDPEGHLLCGQLHLAGMRKDDRWRAIESLRRAVFVAPGHALARFWYANALLADGRHKQALGQLNTLSALLADMPDDQVLGDNEMTVSELREAHDFLLEGLR